MNMFDMMGMMGKLGDAKKKLEVLKAEIAQKSQDFSSTDGRVKVTVAGNSLIKNLEIDPSLLGAENQEELQDVLINTINKGVAEMANQYKDALGKALKEAVPFDIPGLDLKNLL